MAKEIKFENLLEGAARLLEILPEYKKKTNKALQAVDHALNGKPVKKKFTLESGSVYSLVELKALLNTIPDKSLAKMSMSFLDNTGDSKLNVSHADYHYNKEKKEIEFFEEVISI